MFWNQSPDRVKGVGYPGMGSQTHNVITVIDTTEEETRYLLDPIRGWIPKHQKTKGYGGLVVVVAKMD